MQEAQRAILCPVFAQVALTFVVWLSLFIARRAGLVHARADMQELVNEARAQVVFARSIHLSDNLENLFEMPVLFYAAVSVLLATGMTDPVYVGLAWGFVALRALHSLIHCTYNRIAHRFTVYALSSMLIWAIWGRMAWVVVAK